MALGMNRDCVFEPVAYAILTRKDSAPAGFIHAGVLWLLLCAVGSELLP